MVDVVMPTSDGIVVTLPRYVEPKDDVKFWGHTPKTVGF